MSNGSGRGNTVAGTGEEQEDSVQVELSPARQGAPELDPSNPDSIREVMEDREKVAKQSRAEQRASNIRLENMMKNLTNLLEAKASAAEEPSGSERGKGIPGKGSKVKKSDSITANAKKRRAEDTESEIEEVDSEEEEEIQDRGRKRVVKKTVSSYTARIAAEVPVLVRGMTMKEFRVKVGLWEKMVTHSIKKSERAAVLLNKLPTDDDHGGIQTIIIMNHGADEFDTTDGVERLLNEVEKICGGTSFTKLSAWTEKFFNFRQKKDWTITRLITEFHKIVQEGENEYEIMLPNSFKAACLTHFQHELEPETIAQITANLDWKHAEVDRKVEDAIRNYANTRDACAAGNKSKSKKLLLTSAVEKDAMGFPLAGNSSRKVSDSEDEYEDFLLLTREQKKKVSKRKLEKMKEEAKKKGHCLICFEGGHKAENCSQRLSDADKAALREKILNRGDYWLLPTKNAAGEKQWEHKVDGKIVIVNKKGAKAKKKPAVELLVHAVGDSEGFSSKLREIPEDLRMFEDEEDDGENLITTDGAEEIFFKTDTTDSILDTGCSKECGGENWFEGFFNAMEPEDKKEVFFKKSEAAFKFGDGRAVKAIKKAAFPAYFGEQKMFLTADIVKANIPLLISLPTMKKMKLSIHCHKDEGSRENGARAKLYTRNNHHWVRLLKEDAKADHIG